MKRIIFSCILALALGCTDDNNNTGTVADSQTAYADVTADSNDLQEVEEDVGAPDSAAPDVNNTTKHECLVDEDCSSAVECATAACVPLTDGNKCMVFAKLQPKNFCDDADPCTVDVCNTEPKTAKDFADFGCSHKPRPCDDDNACTLNLCDAAVDGGCVYPTNINACDDENACTQDSCTTGGSCEHVAISCDDSIASTEDGCTKAGGCYAHPSECAGDGECSDKDPCTIDWCNADQACIHESMICDDGVACTNDACFGGSCMAISNCIGGDACSENACNLLFGNCEPVGIEKPDGKDCTDDHCDPVNGWTYTKIPGCCVKDSDCQDGNACTEEVCDTMENVCANVPLLVDDGIACTIDTCKLGGYIENKPDDSACTEPNKPHCGIELGCVACTEYAHCDDSDPCTDDNCEWKTGECVHKTKCKAPQICVAESSYTYCDNPEGWCEKDEQCGYKNACSKGACVENFCKYSPISCDDGNLCTTDTCSANWGCEHEWKNCNDNDPCTNDLGCDTTNGECSFFKDAFCIQCTLNEECAPGPVCVDNSVVDYSGTCHQGQCFHSYPEICGSSACYTGSCEKGACIQKVKDCSDDDACTKDFCDYQEGCTGAQVDCDDYDPCTADSCDPNNGCINDWDYTVCPAGPEFNPCGNLWDCAPCKTIGCKDYPETSDLCIGPPNHVCVHGITGLFGGVGIANMGLTTIVVNPKPNNAPPSQNLFIEPGEHIYYPEAESLEVFSVSDAKTETDLGVPPSMPCVNGNGSLTKGKVVGNILTCTTIDF